MILQLTDFQGHFRLPNAPQQDQLAAVREADLSLLRELFAEETVAFIAAQPNDPPASTLRSGGGGLLFPWRDAALWYAQYRIAFGIAGQGIPAAEGTERRVAWYAQVVSSIKSLQKEISRIAAQVWAGEATVVNVGATTELTLPAAAWEWLRVGAPVTVFADTAYQTQVVSLTAPTTVEVAAVVGVPAGTQVRYAINYKLAEKTSLWTGWIS